MFELFHDDARRLIKLVNRGLVRLHRGIVSAYDPPTPKQVGHATLAARP